MTIKLNSIKLLGATLEQPSDVYHSDWISIVINSTSEVIITISEDRNQ